MGGAALSIIVMDKGIAIIGRRYHTQMGIIIILSPTEVRPDPDVTNCFSKAQLDYSSPMVSGRGRNNDSESVARHHYFEKLLLFTSKVIAKQVG